MVALTTKVLVASCLVLAIGIYFYPRDDSFHHFYLSLQWPASFCNTGLNKCFRPVPGNFTIHGLWAQTSNDEQYNCDTQKHKEICDKHPFNYDELKNDTDLMDMMNKNWPNLIKAGRSSEAQQNKKFWKLQWEKHGCCTFKSKQKEYFKKTCEMWEQAPLLVIFEAHKPPITPGRNKKYSLRWYIEAAIQTGLKVEPGTFICNKKIKRKRTSNKQLVEVRLCTDKDVTKFVDCPDHPKPSRSCGKYSTEIAFPS